MLSIGNTPQFLFVRDQDALSRDLDHAVGGKMLQHPRNYLPGCSEVSGDGFVRHIHAVGAVRLGFFEKEDGKTFVNDVRPKS